MCVSVCTHESCESERWVALHHKGLTLDRAHRKVDAQAGLPPSSEPETDTLSPWAVGSEDPEGGRHSRGDSVEAAGLQLQEAVPPVPPGHPEVVDGAPEDQELVPLQCEVRFALRCALRLKSHRAVLQLQRGQM